MVVADHSENGGVEFLSQEQSAVEVVGVHEGDEFVFDVCGRGVFHHVFAASEEVGAVIVG